MCFNKETSLASFFIGSLSGFALTRYGNKEYETANKIIGYFFMYVSLMQLVDYFIWIDLDCTKGYNKFIGYIGPLLNNLQPVVLYLLCKKYLALEEYKSFDTLAKYCNAIYFIYTMVTYYNYVSSSNLCSTLSEGKHVKWAWAHLNNSNGLAIQDNKQNNYFNYQFYQLMMLINMLIFMHDKVMLLSMLISYIFFFISYKYYKTNIGELWCYFVVYVPLLILVGQKMKNSNQ